MREKRSFSARTKSCGFWRSRKRSFRTCRKTKGFSCKKEKNASRRKRSGSSNTAVNRRIDFACTVEQTGTRRHWQPLYFIEYPEACCGVIHYEIFFGEAQKESGFEQTEYKNEENEGTKNILYLTTGVLIIVSILFVWKLKKRKK